MTAVPVTSIKRTFVGYDLIITARALDAHAAEIYTALMVNTTKLWLYLAKQIGEGVKQLPEAIAFKSAEKGIEGNYEGLEFAQGDEKRVTVFDWNHKLELTLHSDSMPQIVLDLYWAKQAALEQLEALYPSAPQSAQDAPNSSAPAPQGTSTPQPPQAPTNGIIAATRAPNPNSPMYSDGQLVSFTINKIVATANQGSATFQMWGPLGRQYAVHTLYRTDKSGNLKKDYEQVKPLLDGLKLSLEKPEAQGTWQLVCRATHAEKEGKTKEYMNLVSLVALSS